MSPNERVALVSNTKVGDTEGKIHICIPIL